jgi:uncharacterized membrane-anchored protein YhcB (DUF1043 family)
MFYKLFIKQGNTLKDTFENMRNSFEDYILKSNGCDMTMRDVLEYSNSFPNEEKDTFQWGLFYKDISYGTITINSLLEVANTELDVLDKKIRDKKTELGKGQAKLAAFQGNIPEALKEVYDELADGAKKLNNELNGLTEYREKIYRNIQKKEAEEKRQTLCNHFSNAIKRINYHEQREIYRMGAESLFGCYAAMGDPDCLIDLLLIKFSEDYELKGNHFFPLTICYTSNIGKKFWPELAIQLQLDENADEQVIVRKMIEDIYFGSQLDIARSSHQHIFIKILIHGVPGEQVGTMVKSFWLAIQKFMTQYAFLGDKQIAVRHRIIMLLLDDSAGPERIDEIEKITVSINNEIETKLKIMPWIKPLNLEQIENWIVGNDLDRVGIEKKMAQDIFTESESGKIKKVLLSVKERTDIKDLDLFQQLNL